MEKMLQINNLKIVYRKNKKSFLAVDCVNLSLNKGEVLGIVGESGSGKSTLGLSIIRLLPTRAKIKNGDILFNGESICKLKESKFNKEYRGKKISYIPQNPQSSLNPVFTVGRQLKDIIKFRTNIKDVHKKAVNMLFKMGIADAETRMKEYPHQFSGGMKQRVLLAMAFVTNPTLLIADEPTTALDVTVEAQILSLLKKLIKEYNSSIIYISHDLGVVSEIADRVAVFYAGRVLEINGRDNIFENPHHPYTEALIKCLPDDNKDKKLDVIPGDIPDLSELPSGCNFQPRCNYKQEKCCEEKPPLFSTDNKGKSACFFHEKVGKQR